LPEDSIRPYLENAVSSWLENIVSVEEAA
jgi:hypothetical protein